MDVLDESFDTLGNCSLPHFDAILLLPRHLVTCECFMEHSDKRAVSGKKYCMCGLVPVSASSGNVQSDKGFAGSRHTCDEANEFVALRSRLIHQLFNTARSDMQILRSRIVARDSIDRVLSIKSPRSFHDGGSRMIRSA